MAVTPVTRQCRRSRIVHLLFFITITSSYALAHAQIPVKWPHAHHTLYLPDAGFVRYFSTRVESDTFGPLDVPADRWGRCPYSTSMQFQNARTLD